MANKAVSSKKKTVKVDAMGQLHIHSSFNNIIVSLANSEGQIISWSSAGKMGFRGSKKNTPYAAQTAAENCAKTAFDLGLRKVKAYVKGPGNGREAAIRAVHGAGIEVSEIVDVTPLPHNGCRPPKRIWLDIQVLNPELRVVLASLSSVPTKFCRKRATLRVSMEIHAVARLLSTAPCWLRSRKQNTLTVFSRNSSAIHLQRQSVPKVLQVKCFFSFWSLVSTTLFTAWA